MQLSKTSFVYRFVTWVRVEPWEGTNLCPFFWVLTVAILLLPLRIFGVIYDYISYKTGETPRTYMVKDFDAARWEQLKHDPWVIDQYRWAGAKSGFIMLIVAFALAGLIATIIGLATMAIANLTNSMIVVGTIIGLVALIYGLVKSSALPVMWEYAKGIYHKVCPALDLIE